MGFFTPSSIAFAIKDSVQNDRYIHCFAHNDIDNSINIIYYYEKLFR